MIYLGSEMILFGVKKIRFGVRFILFGVPKNSFPKTIKLLQANKSFTKFIGKS